MKKLVCLILALALCMSVTAMAETTPSKTTADLTEFDVIAENQPDDPNLYLLPINELASEGTLPSYEDHTSILQQEIAKLSSDGVDSYFAGATDSQGNPVDLRKMLGLAADAKLNVYEFCEVIAGGFNENCGKVTATLLFPTPYEKDEKVSVLIGIVNQQQDGAYTVTWQAFDGVGMDTVAGQNGTNGSVKVELTQEVVLAIANGIALMAVVSK